MDSFWRATRAATLLLFLTGCSDRPVGNRSATNTAKAAEQYSAVDPGGEERPAPPAAHVSNLQIEAEPAAALETKSTLLLAQIKKEPPPVALAKQHEPLFVGWPQPQFALIVTGRQNGYIEPCGCTGLANQKGGMARRLTLLQQLRDKGWPLVALDVGNQVKRFGRQSEIKFQIAAEGLKKMDYKAIGFGPDDLRLSTGELLAAISDQPTRFVSANATVLDPDLTLKMQIIAVAGKKIGVTAVLGDEYRKKISSDEIVLTPAAVGLQAVVPKLKAQACDILVLLANATLEESRKLAQQFPDFQLVVTAGGAEEPAFEPEVVAGTKTRLVQVGAKGMYVGVLGFFADPRQPFRFQRVPLDDRFADAREMLGLLSAYQDQLKVAGLEGLGLKPVPHPSNSQFVGSEKCGECHSKAFAVWEKTPHAHATESLVNPGERSDIARHFDPECLSCHVTGWDPQKFIPFASGYLGLKSTPLMHGSGCENCHGPGSAHVEAESNAGQTKNDALTKLRTSMRLPLAQAEHKCMECHDLDNSPDFHTKDAFKKFWKQVEHLGKD